MGVGTFLGIIALMFVLELPDKTMVATLVMSARARPWTVALGASAGFVVQMGIAVCAGGLLTLLPHVVKNVIVALLFLGGAAYLLLVSEKSEEQAGQREGRHEHASGAVREMLTAFGVIFIGEFGDLTQIQAANFAARLRAPLLVFVACCIALIAVAFVGSFAGKIVTRFVPLATVRYIGGGIFLVLGIVTAVQLFL